MVVKEVSVQPIGPNCNQRRIL